MVTCSSLLRCVCHMPIIVALWSKCCNSYALHNGFSGAVSRFNATPVPARTRSFLSHVSFRNSSPCLRFSATQMHTSMGKTAKSLLLGLPPVYVTMASTNRVSGTFRTVKTDLNLEHIVPRSHIRQTAQHSVKKAERDMHNIYACPIHLNQARGNLPFSNVDMDAVENLNTGCAYDTGSNSASASCSLRTSHSQPHNLSSHAPIELDTALGHGNFLGRTRFSSHRFIPNPVSHGLIARCILYMSEVYHCDANSVVDGGMDTAWRWHYKNPPHPTELLHNYFAFKVQNTTNRFITNETTSRGMLMEYFDALGVLPRADVSETSAYSVHPNPLSCSVACNNRKLSRSRESDTDSDDASDPDSGPDEIFV